MPFTRGNVLKQGAHLHFILPDAFTHAEEKNGIFCYPTLPNRWLVTRLVSDEKKIKAKSWVVESDYIGLDNENSITIPQLDYDAPYKCLGRCYELGKEVNGQEFYLTTCSVSRKHTIKKRGIFYLIRIGCMVHGIYLNARRGEEKASVG